MEVITQDGQEALADIQAMSAANASDGRFVQLPISTGGGIALSRSSARPWHAQLEQLFVGELWPNKRYLSQRQEDATECARRLFRRHRKVTQKQLDALYVQPCRSFIEHSYDGDRPEDVAPVVPTPDPLSVRLNSRERMLALFQHPAERRRYLMDTHDRMHEALTGEPVTGPRRSKCKWCVAQAATR